MTKQEGFQQFLENAQCRWWSARWWQTVPHPRASQGESTIVGHRPGARHEQLLSYVASSSLSAKTTKTFITCVTATADTPLPPHITSSDPENSLCNLVGVGLMAFEIGDKHLHIKTKIWTRKLCVTYPERMQTILLAPLTFIPTQTQRQNEISHSCNEQTVGPFGPHFRGQGAKMSNGFWHKKNETLESPFPKM